MNKTISAFTENKKESNIFIFIAKGPLIIRNNVCDIKSNLCFINFSNILPTLFNNINFHVKAFVDSIFNNCSYEEFPIDTSVNNKDKRLQFYLQVIYNIMTQLFTWCWGRNCICCSM